MSKVRWTQKNTNDLEKALHYPLSVTKEPVTIVYPGGEERRYLPPSRVEISPSFYRSVTCRMCRRCCFSFSKFWTLREHSVLVKLYPELASNPRADWGEIEVGINGSKHVFWKLPETKEIGCVFLDQRRGCLIHDMNPLHCRVPLIKFKRSRTRVTRVTKEQFGRNWAFGCPVKFGKLSKEEFYKWDLEVMGRIKHFADDLGLATWIDWVIKELKRNFPNPLPHKDVLDL